MVSGGLQPELRLAEASGMPRLYSRQTLTSPRRSHIPQAATGDAQMIGLSVKRLLSWG